MGYSMSLRDADFRIRKENFAKALSALRRSTEDWSWFRGEIQCETLSTAVMNHFEWNLIVDLTGDISDIEFHGEKLGEDADVFEALAPWIEDGCYIEMQGEDGNSWRWVFSEGKLIELEPVIIWPKVK